jgi:hypothetical protein
MIVWTIVQTIISVILPLPEQADFPSPAPADPQVF